jgi:hypothetical protein
MSDILTRRQTRFVLWCPATVASPPDLIIGQLQNGNPPSFKPLVRKALQRAPGDIGTLGGLFELDASVLGLTDGQTYHYWFEIQNTSPGATGRVQTTDPARGSRRLPVVRARQPFADPSGIGDRILRRAACRS